MGCGASAPLAVDLPAGGPAAPQAPAASSAAPAAPAAAAADVGPPPPPASREQPTSAKFESLYKLGDKLGSGGFATVRVATRTSTGACLPAQSRTPAAARPPPGCRCCCSSSS